MVRAITKLHLMTFMQVDIRHCYCYSQSSLPKFSRSNFSIDHFNKYRLEKSKHHHCHQIGSQIFAIEWRHCDCCTSLTYIFKVRKFEMWIWKTVRASEKCSNKTFGGCYIPSNKTIAIGILKNLDFHFQGQTCSCFAFAIKKMKEAADDLRIFASTRTATAVGCSCSVSWGLIVT